MKMSNSGEEKGRSRASGRLDLQRRNSNLGVSHPSLALSSSRAAAGA